jgi:hypothetical protein
MTQSQRRRPVEAIEARNRRAAECEDRVRKAVAKLVKTGLPFTVEDVCRQADVGKTFVYDKKRPQLTQLVLDARDTSQLAVRAHADRKILADHASWRERALNAEARVSDLRAKVRRQDAQIGDLTGQLFDPEGNHLADENARLRRQIDALNRQITNISTELASTQRSLLASRTNVRREQERNLALVQPSSRIP